jgi:hypothetical protein
MHARVADSNFFKTLSLQTARKIKIVWSHCINAGGDYCKGDNV